MSDNRIHAIAPIEARDLWKVYCIDGQDVRALCGVSLTVQHGEFVAVVGPSGSGKSTLLHLIGAMDSPTRGEVFLNGQHLAGMTESARTRLRCREVGMLFQTFNLLPTLTASENVEVAMRLAGVPQDERRRRTTDLFECLGLATRLKHLPSQLSGGERQRVALARAVANEPTILLPDEPTGNLDTVTGEDIVRLLRQLNDQGQTIVLVTHNPEVAAQASRRLHMRDGQVGELSSPAAVY
jgi:putative ABC transport system ATP-binding protein